VNNYGAQRSSTNNAFFLELSQTISVLSFEKPLVDFFYNLGAGNSMIRVRSLSMHPDAARQQLSATITLVASYQKKTRTPSASTAPRTTAPAATPAATPAAKPATPPTKPTSPPPAPNTKPIAPRVPTPNKK
jgi:hypothetical protein